MNRSENRSDVLLKTDDGREENIISERAALENSRKFNYNKRAVNGICQMLCEESDRYRPGTIVKSIEQYIESYEKIDRILYSEISNDIFSLC